MKKICLLVAGFFCQIYCDPTLEETLKGFLGSFLYKKISLKDPIDFYLEFYDLDPPASIPSFEMKNLKEHIKREIVSWPYVTRYLGLSQIKKKRVL